MPHGHARTSQISSFALYFGFGPHLHDVYSMESCRLSIESRDTTGTILCIYVSRFVKYMCVCRMSVCPALFKDGITKNIHAMYTHTNVLQTANCKYMYDVHVCKFITHHTSHPHRKRKRDGAIFVHVQVNTCRSNM